MLYQARSFAEVVRGSLLNNRVLEADRNQKSFTMQWKKQPDNEDWLARSFIGVLKEFSSVNKVSRRLISRDYSFSSSYLGDENILWCFESELEMEGFLKNRFF